jgi:hypothetical protein
MMLCCMCYLLQVELLSRIHHRNLVTLVGYCDEGSHQMLVYEFLHKGNLQEHLYGGSPCHKHFFQLFYIFIQNLNTIQHKNLAQTAYQK